MNEGLARNSQRLNQLSGDSRKARTFLTNRFHSVDLYIDNTHGIFGRFKNIMKVHGRINYYEVRYSEHISLTKRSPETYLINPSSFLETMNFYLYDQTMQEAALGFQVTRKEGLNAFPPKPLLIINGRTQPKDRVLPLIRKFMSQLLSIILLS